MEILEKKGVIKTVSGRLFDVFNPEEDMVDLGDITHALSMMCRFNSHTPIFYSVASHSIIGGKLIEKKFKKEFLGHDFAEAYTGDCITPIKKNLPEWYVFEAKIERVINGKFGTPYPMSKEVKEMDSLMLRMEQAYLMGEQTDEIFPMSRLEFLIEICKTHKEVAKELKEMFESL